MQEFEKLRDNNSIYIPVPLQKAVGIQKGNIVSLRVVGDVVTIRKAIFTEHGDKSNEATLAWVLSALRDMPQKHLGEVAAQLANEIGKE